MIDSRLSFQEILRQRKKAKADRTDPKLDPQPPIILSVYVDGEYGSHSISGYDCLYDGMIHSCPTIVPPNRFYFRELNFPMDKSHSGCFEFDFLRCTRPMSPEDAACQIVNTRDESDRDKHWVAGGIEHLLTLEAVFPKAFREQTIVASGSVPKIYGQSLVPVLTSNLASTQRFLKLYKYNGHFDPGVLFLKVRRTKENPTYWI